MEFGPYSMLIDFCIMSGLLFIAHMLRSKIKFFQNLYIPSALIAGFIGLFLGPQFLNVLPFSAKTGSYAYLLVIILFAGLFLGKNEGGGIKETVEKVGDTFFVNMSAEIMGFGISALVGGALVMIVFPDVFSEICLLLPAGFTGGHGYAAAIGGTLNNLLGREDGIYIGQTFATIGMLVGLIGGISFINIATRKGATNFVKDIGNLPESCRTGFVQSGERVILGKETIHPMALDPLAWHALLVLIATGLGYGAYQLYKPFAPNIEIPMMCLTMLAGVLIQFILNKIGRGDSVDKHIINRIGSTVTDYLVGFGIATIKISVVLEFLGPILLLCVLGLVWPSLLVWVVGRKLFHNNWFERSIFIFGYITGVVAIGVTLLRVVDPEMKSGTLDDFGTAYTLQAIIELFLVTMAPIFAVSVGVIPTGIVLVLIGVALLGICRHKYGIHDRPLNQLNEKRIS